MATNTESDALGLRSVISVKRFLDSWDKDIDDLFLYSKDKIQPGQSENELIAEKLGISVDLADELAVVCGPETLCCGDEPADKAELLKMKGLPQNIDLTTVKYQERELERRRMVDYKVFTMNKMKYRVMDVFKIGPESKGPQPDVKDEDRVPFPNVVLCVMIYRTRINTTFLPKGQTFEVLGTQYLTELKDAISCMKDDAIAGEFSNYPNLPEHSLTPAKQIYKSGMFFIENVFYNDMREDDNKDYSAPILKWAHEKGHENAALFKTAKMEETRFVDLDIQLGVPYMYQHQGHCEHIIVFTDIRLLHGDDSQDINMYPYLVTETLTRRTICRSCLMESARWVVYDSALTPESPCFLCQSCLALLHYDQDGNKIGSFRAYKYRQKPTLPGTRV